MTSIDELLLKALDNLESKEIERFKWHLKNHEYISTADVEKANAFKTVDIMVRRFTPEGAVNITVDILGLMNENHLAEQLKNWTATAKKEIYRAQMLLEPHFWICVAVRFEDVTILADKLLQQKIINEEQYTQITESQAGDEPKSLRMMRQMSEIISKRSDTVKVKFMQTFNEAFPGILRPFLDALDVP